MSAPGTWDALAAERGGDGAVSRSVAIGHGAPIGDSPTAPAGELAGILRAKVWGKRARGTSNIRVHVETADGVVCFPVFSGTPEFGAVLSARLGARVTASVVAVKDGAVPGRVRCTSFDGTSPPPPREERCLYCGKPFFPRSSAHVFCSAECRRADDAESARERARRWQREHPAEHAAAQARYRARLRAREPCEDGRR